MNPIEKTFSTIYECWSDGDAEGVELSFFPEDNTSARETLTSSAKLLYKFEASSWDEAMTEHHRRQGWEPYIPISE